MTLLHRTPEAIESLRERMLREYPQAFQWIRDAYAAEGRDADPEALQRELADVNARAIQQALQATLQTVMDSGEVGNRLIEMKWGVLSLIGTKYPLLTSDRPIVMTNGIGRPDSYMILPISPDKVFVAAGSEKTAAEIIEQDRQRQLGRMLNDRVVRQARRYAYGSDDSQLAFIEKRLGEKMR
jgi:hypothetical protein